MMLPFDRGFNVAVKTLAGKVYPTGFDLADSVTDCYHTMRAETLARGRLTVWRGGSENTIFGCAETNYCFRAWHDWTHIHHDFDFTLQGEFNTALSQIDQLRALYPGHDRLDAWCAMVWIDVAAQALFYHRHGSFIQNQRGFALHHLANRGIVL